MYAFFWVILRRLNFIYRRFGTLCSIFISPYEDGTDRMFRNVGIQNSDAGELPRRKHTTFKTGRKFEIKNVTKRRQMHKEVIAARHKRFPTLLMHSIVVWRDFFVASQNVIGPFRTNQCGFHEARCF
jgi:hypothetical protein